MKEQNIDWHLLLDAAGLLPAVGAAFDGINTAWYAAEGDWENALLSGLAFVPGIGEAVGAGKTSVKIGGKIIGHMDEAADIAKAADKAGNVAEAAGKAGKTGKRAGKFGKYADEAIESDSNFKGQIYKGVRNSEIDFVNDKGKSTLTKHAGKHGYASSEEYLKDAREFLEKQPTSTTQSFVSAEGTYFRYDTATNEFGIINQYGGISTYFKPEEGMVYWLEQIEKYAQK